MEGALARYCIFVTLVAVTLLFITRKSGLFDIKKSLTFKREEEKPRLQLEELANRRLLAYATFTKGIFKLSVTERSRCKLVQPFWFLVSPSESKSPAINVNSTPKVFISEREDEERISIIAKPQKKNKKKEGAKTTETLVCYSIFSQPDNSGLVRDLSQVPGRIRDMCPQRLGSQWFLG